MPVFLEDTATPHNTRDDGAQLAELALNEVGGTPAKKTTALLLGNNIYKEQKGQTRFAFLLFGNAALLEKFFWIPVSVQHPAGSW